MYFRASVVKLTSAYIIAPYTYVLISILMYYKP